MKVLSLILLQLYVCGVALCTPYSCIQSYQPSQYARRGSTHVPSTCTAGAPSSCPRSWKAGVLGGRLTTFPLINIDFIKCIEGFSLCGYVPINEANGEVIGNSGVTIASGIDLGERDRNFISALPGVSLYTKNRLEPYLGLQGRTAACAAIERPLRISNNEANTLTTAVMDSIVNNIANRYNQQREGNSVLFNSLPRGVRTAISSIFFQYGSESRISTLWGFVRRNDWNGAIGELRNFRDNFPQRRNNEADILKAAVSQCNRSIDAVFLLDESGSVYYSDFRLSLNFIESIINTFPDDRIGGENGSRFGLSLFDNSYRSVFYLSTYSNKSQYLSAISSVSQYKGQTNLGNALRHINYDQFTEQNGMQPEERAIPRILIVMTDGQSRDAVSLPALNIRDRNIVIYAIGIGSYNIHQLNEIASSPSHVETLTFFSGLSEFAGTLTAASCYESRPVTLNMTVTGNVERNSFQYYSFVVERESNLKVEINDTDGRTFVYASRDNPHPYRYDSTFGFTSSFLSEKVMVIAPFDRQTEPLNPFIYQTGIVYISVTADTDTAAFLLEGTTCDPTVCSESMYADTATEGTTTSKAMVIRISAVIVAYAPLVAIAIF